MALKVGFVAALILFGVPLVVQAQVPVVIDFDDLVAPCDLGLAQPLRDEYAALGVEFVSYTDDGGAALDECSGLGVAGYSSPNFVVIDPEGLLANGGVPDILSFGFTGDAPNHVSLKAGGTPGTTAYLVCTICPWSVPWCDVGQEFVLDSVMQTVVVSSESRFRMGCSVRIGGPVGTMIVDDLELRFEVAGASIPSLSRTGAAILMVLLAALGAMAVRRVSGIS